MEITTAELAKRESVSARTVQGWAQRGLIKSRRTSGGHLMFDANVKRPVTKPGRPKTQ